MIYSITQLANYPNSSYSGYCQRFIARDIDSYEILGLVDTPKNGECECDEEWVIIREKIFVNAETPTSAIMKFRFWECSNLPVSWLLEKDVEFDWSKIN